MINNLNMCARIIRSVHKDKGWDKMFIALNNSNARKNNIVLPFIGNEHLLKSLGSDVVLKLPDNELKDRVLVYCEYNDNALTINDGVGCYTLK